MCNIQLDNYNGQYLAGSTITGKLICKFRSSENTRGIFIKLKGVEKVYWRRGKHTYSRKNKFLSDERQILSEGYIDGGRTEYLFSFILPQDIPTSFEAKYGWVTYSLKAKVDIPFGFDYKDKFKFHVVRPVELDTVMDRSAFFPGTFEAEKTACCLCYYEGHLSMEVHLEKKGFVPGETIKVGVRILNTSNADIKNVKVIFQMVIKSSIGHCLGEDSIEEKIVVAKTNSDGFSASEREKYYEIFLKLPIFDAVPNFLYSKILSFRSKLKVIGVMSMFHRNLKISIPMYLGDVPLGGKEDYFRRFNSGEVVSFFNDCHSTSATIRMMGLYK